MFLILLVWCHQCACKKAGKGGELTHDETTIIAGALELTAKTARDAMTPISETFAIDINARLDRYNDSFWNFKDIKTSGCLCFMRCMTFLLLYRDLMKLILDKGHSRVPVFYEQSINIIGLILVIICLCYLHSRSWIGCDGYENCPLFFFSSALANIF